MPYSECVVMQYAKIAPCLLRKQCRNFKHIASLRRQDCFAAPHNAKKEHHRNCDVLQQRYQDSNLEMTESESVALPFGDSAMS